jgi:NADH-quinone oxidoreductase subunit N
MLAFSLTLALASLAGLPLTAGFMGKFLVFFSITLEGNYGSLLIAIIGAAAGFYYYFKIILALHSPSEGEPPVVRLSPLSKTALGFFVAAILVVGVYPECVRGLLVKSPVRVAGTK